MEEGVFHAFAEQYISEAQDRGAKNIIPLLKAIGPKEPQHIQPPK